MIKEKIIRMSDKVLPLIVAMLVMAPGATNLIGLMKVVQGVVGVYVFFSFASAVLGRALLAGGSGRVSLGRSVPDIRILSFYFLFLLFHALVFWSLVRGAFGSDEEVSAQSYLMISYHLMILSVSFDLVEKSGFRGAVEKLGILFDCIFFLCLVNLILWAMGVTNASAQDNLATSGMASLYASMGINQPRVFFPMSLGVNNFGIVSGLAMAYFLARSFVDNESTKERVVSLLKAVVPAVCLSLSDSRGAVVFAVMALVSARFRAFRLLVLLLALLFPVAMIFDLISVDEVADIALSGRDGEGFLTGRETIWIGVLSELSNFSFDHVVGFGAYGQSASGVSQTYGPSLAGFGKSYELISPHNGVFQVVLDLGYLGLSVLLTLLTLTIYLCRQSMKSQANAAGVHYPILVVLLFVVMQSLTESCLSIYSVETFFVLTVILLLVPSLARGAP